MKLLNKKYFHDLTLSTYGYPSPGENLHNADDLVVTVKFLLPRKKAHKLYDRLAVILRKRWAEHGH